MTFQVSDWWRDEVEFKPVDSPLPLDIVEQRDQYFAGAYPYLAKVLPTVEAQPLITRRERMPQQLAAAMLDPPPVREQPFHCQRGLLRRHRGRLVKIVGKKHNKALVEAGVLLVDHD